MSLKIAPLRGLLPPSHLSLSSNAPELDRIAISQSTCIWRRQCYLPWAPPCWAWTSSSGPSKHFPQNQGCRATCSPPLKRRQGHPATFWSSTKVDSISPGHHQCLSASLVQKGVGFQRTNVLWNPTTFSGQYHPATTNPLPSTMPQLVGCWPL